MRILRKKHLFTSSSMVAPILQHSAIEAILKRMAYQLYEQNYDSDSLVFISIGERGRVLTKSLIAHLQKISPIIPDYIEGTISPAYTVVFSPELNNLKGKKVVVVDDVLHTGRTMLTVVCEILVHQPSSIQVAVLVDRGHRTLPVSPDFVGIRLATTLQEHVYFQQASDGSLQVLVE